MIGQSNDGKEDRIDSFSRRGPKQFRADAARRELRHLREQRDIFRKIGHSLRTVLERAEAEPRLKLIAKKWQKSSPKLSACWKPNVPEALTVFAFPEGHRRRLRTTNGLERLNQELKRRTASPDFSQ